MPLHSAVGQLEPVVEVPPDELLLLVVLPPLLPEAPVAPEPPVLAVVEPEPPALVPPQEQPEKMNVRSSRSTRRMGTD